MSVRIRLALHGCTNRPFYHVVVAPSRAKRNGRHLEQVGCYDPMPNYNKEEVVGLNVERIRYWLSVGAHPTLPVYRLLGLAGLLPVHPRHYLEASRKRATEATAVTTPNEATSGNETESSSGVGSNTEPDGTSSSDSDSGSDKEP